MNKERLKLLNCKNHGHSVLNVHGQNNLLIQFFQSDYGDADMDIIFLNWIEKPGTWSSFVEIFSIMLRSWADLQQVSISKLQIVNSQYHS